MFNGLALPAGGSPTESLTRGISIVGELWESSGRCVGVSGGFVSLGEVWQFWELHLSFLVKIWARFG